MIEEENLIWGMKIRFPNIYQKIAWVLTQTHTHELSHACTHSHSSITYTQFYCFGDNQIFKGLAYYQSL